MLKKKSFWIVFTLLVISVGTIVYQWLYHEHRDIQTETASFTLTANEMHKEFTETIDIANTKYLDKTVAIQGELTEIDTVANIIVLNEKINVIFLNEKVAGLAIGETLQIKGRCLGFDDLLEQVSFDNAALIQE
jgi:hypothetical protein